MNIIQTTTIEGVDFDPSGGANVRIGKCIMNGDVCINRQVHRLPISADDDVDALVAAVNDDIGSAGYPPLDVQMIRSILQIIPAP